MYLLCRPVWNICNKFGRPVLTTTTNDNNNKPTISNAP